jgi:hypothetical protein
MADFIILVGDHGYEHVNLDLVRRITEDMDGTITLHFDSTHTKVLEGQEARQFKVDFDRRWREKVDAATNTYLGR